MTLKQLDIFKLYIQGDFNNEDQINRQKEEGNITHPYAQHVNRIGDDQIENLPTDLKKVEMTKFQPFLSYWGDISPYNDKRRGV